jgi:MtN3 and saliva related transmembrane protein
MFLTLFAGIALWVVYGVLRHDAVVLIANAISLCCLAGISLFQRVGRETPQAGVTRITRPV